MLRIPIDNKELVVFCIHLIPFNEHNNIRNQEIEYLLKLATKETRKGNYVIIGGDFNTDLSNLSFKEFCVNSDSKGTIRSLRKAYTKSSKNKNYDGFITSSNIKVLKVSSFDNYEYSDHSPVIIEIII